MALTIVTNHVMRQLVYGYQLTEKERAEFDYISEEDITTHEFVRYKGKVYDTCEFMRCELNGLDQKAWEQWDGYSSDSAFSGVLIKYIDSDYVVMGTYFS